MSSQRPFFGNFLAAFRAHAAMQKATAASTSQSALPATAAAASRSYTHTRPSASSSTDSYASPSQQNTATKAGQPIPTSTSTNPSSSSAAAATTAFHSSNRQQQHAATPSPYSRSPASPASPPSGFQHRASSKRRGSDSSTEGFRDVLGEQKWYIGGRTATGEERFYKLGVVKRARSIDRLSLDRMSL